MSCRRLTAMGSKQCVNRSTVMDGWTSAKRAAITDQLVNLSSIIYRHARGENEKSTAPGIQRAAQTVLVVYLKRTYSRVTSASSALAVLNDYALYKSTHSLTHSLTRPGEIQIAVSTQTSGWTDDIAHTYSISHNLSRMNF